MEWRIASRKNRATNLAYLADRGYFGGPGSLRLAAQDVALSRRKQGFESPRERQSLFVHSDFSSVFEIFPEPAGLVWAMLFAFRPSSKLGESLHREGRLIGFPRVTFGLSRRPMPEHRRNFICTAASFGVASAGSLA